MANSYGRIEFRMNGEGEIFFLEINPNCGMFGTCEHDYGCGDVILINDLESGHL